MKNILKIKKIVVTRSRKQKKDKQYNGQKKKDKRQHDKQLCTQHYTENYRISHMNSLNKGNNKITELWTIFQRESQNS